MIKDPDTSVTQLVQFDMILKIFAECLFDSSSKNKINIKNSIKKFEI